MLGIISKKYFFNDIGTQIFSIAKGVQHGEGSPFWKPAFVFAHYVRIVFAMDEINLLLLLLLLSRTGATPYFAHTSPTLSQNIVQPATQSRSGLGPSSSDFSVVVVVVVVYLYSASRSVSNALMYRGQGPSLASGPSVMPARLRRTHCRATSAKQSTLLVLESC